MLQRLRSLLGAIPRRPNTVDWTLDEKALLERMKSEIVTRNGHVYLSVPNLLPPALYDACLAYWPQHDKFERRTPTRSRITLAWLDKSSLDDDQRNFWRKFGHEIVNGKIKPVLIDVFMPYMRHKFDFLSKEEISDIQKNVRYVDYLEEGLNSDKGFTIGPHVDQNYIFISNLLYMPPDRWRRDLGTTLFQPLDPNLRTMDTTYIDESMMRPVHRFPFTPNTLVSFLQTPVAFHGFAGRKSLRPRPSYQFNVQMDEETVVRAYGADANTVPDYGDYSRKAS